MAKMIASASPAHKKPERKAMWLLALRLTNDIMNAGDTVLDGAESLCERIAVFFGAVIFAGVLGEVWLAFEQFPIVTELGRWGPVWADAAVAIGVGLEVWFGFRGAKFQGELTRRSKNELTEAKGRLAQVEFENGFLQESTAMANERAVKADLSRAELETKLLPRMLNQAQWDFIQGLRGKLNELIIAYETDAETRWYADNIRGAFISAGINVGTVARAAEVHSFGTLIYEPKGFDGGRPKSVEPLIEVFRRADVPVACAVITEIPADILSSMAHEDAEMPLPPSVPIVIIGGRFVIPPPHIERAAMAVKAAMDAAANQRLPE
ncbi:MAG: hypothetical protein KGJ53_13085 [Alphaproteobacteria bacterium]|nr:hypothetical protein [Alphaproteobacteria bacterium]